jgi:hypothetical protein
MSLLLDSAERSAKEEAVKPKCEPHHGAAMSFTEIAEQLGITRGGAWMAYKSAMRKLKKPRNQRLLETMLKLARAKDQRSL